MFQPKDDFNTERSQNAQDNNLDKNADNNLDNIDANLSAENVAARKQQLQSIFTKLIIFGLALGTVLGIGAYYLLNKFGLTKKPYQIEQEKIEQEKIKREQQPNSPVEEIKSLPRSDTYNERFGI